MYTSTMNTSCVVLYIIFWLLLFLSAPHLHILKARELVRTSACVFAKGGAPKRRTNNPLGSRERGHFLWYTPIGSTSTGRLHSPSIETKRVESIQDYPLGVLLSGVYLNHECFMHCSLYTYIYIYHVLVASFSLCAPCAHSKSARTIAN